MGPGLIALFCGIGVAAWAYVKLAKLNGNANPASNMVIAGVGGVAIFFVLFTLLKMVLHF